MLQKWAEHFDELINGQGAEESNQGIDNDEGETESTGNT
jgi:hypothetical protein